MNLFYEPGIPEGVHFLNEEESRHAAKVLRLRPGDAFRATDGQGSFYTCRATNVGKSVTFEVIEREEVPRLSYYIHVAIAPTKNHDRIEWFVEKSVEIGVQEIGFMICKHSERTRLRTDRLMKKAAEAMKQSGQAYMPVMREAKTFADVVEQAYSEAFQKFIAYVDPSNDVSLKNAAAPARRYLILIGPEGDFSQEELALAFKHDFLPVSLGPNRLRTETAGIAACHTLNLING